MSIAIAPAEDLTPRSAPRISAANVRLDFQGYVTRSFFVRLPEGFVADDLKDPSVWSAAQSTHALRSHDKLYLVAYDESWVADAIVAQADSSSVVIVTQKIKSFPERYEKLFETELFKVAWAGNGYAVFRKGDNQRMTSPVSSAQIAERDLINLHPRVAGA